MTVRFGTLLLVAPQFRGYLQMRPGPAWPSERERWFSIAVISGLTAITLGNLIVASLGYLQFLMLTALVAPLSIFYNTVREASRCDPDPAPPEIHSA